MARLGTPENPEVIEPGHRPRSTPVSPLRRRLETGFRLIKSLALVCAPAALLDYAWVSLVSTAWHEQSAFSFLLALLISPPALIATGFAALAGPLLLASILFLMLGRPVLFDSPRARPFTRFGFQRR